MAVNNIGWRTFIMFGCFCFGMATFVLLFIPETKQLTLEEIDVLFGAVDSTRRQQDVENALAERKLSHAEENEGMEERVEGGKA